MSIPIKNVNELTVSDLEAFPVWEYVNSDESGELRVRAIKRKPVRNATGKVFGTKVRLANGELVWALIGNIDASNPRLTRHFMTLSIERNGKWFALARYHDIDAEQRGPAALASFLGLPLKDVYPISYDLRAVISGNLDAVVNVVEKEPQEKLTRAQIIALAISEGV